MLRPPPSALPVDYRSIKPDDRGILKLCHYEVDHLFPHEVGADPSLDEAKLRARADRAAKIADDEAALEKQLGRVLESVKRNHPVLFYSSLSLAGEIHVVTIAGFCRLREAGGPPKLWLLIADPATAQSYASRNPKNELKVIRDLSQLDKLTSEHSIVVLVPGEWGTAQGALYLLRASLLFREKPHHALPHGLWLDYWGTDHNLKQALQNAGARICIGDKLKPTEIADGGVISSFTSWKYGGPFNRPGTPFNPWRLYANNESSANGVGGYYVIGLNQNVHSGIHLFPQRHQRLEASASRNHA